MITKLKIALYRLFGIKHVVSLPPDIRLTGSSGRSDMRFNLSLGFDLVFNSDGILDIHVNSMTFAADGEVSTRFIRTASASVLKDTASALALAASVHISNTPVDSYTKGSLLDDIQPPTDPKLLN